MEDHKRYERYVVGFPEAALFKSCRYGVKSYVRVIPEVDYPDMDKEGVREKKSR